MLHSFGLKTIQAVEPNKNMRLQGERNLKGSNINWIDGSGENTGLSNNSADIVSMASSFHWVNFDKGIKEFSRILRPNGLFVALWNPRFTDNDPMLMEIEDHLKYLKGSEISRISSGRSEFTSNLLGRLEKRTEFANVVYMESKHNIIFSKERYMGAWRSVNDIRVQLGESDFISFLNWVQNKIKKVDYINATYQTRAWVAKKHV